MRSTTTMKLTLRVLLFIMAPHPVLPLIHPMTIASNHHFQVLLDVKACEMIVSLHLTGGWFQKGFFTQKTHSNPVKAQQSDREHDESRVTVSEDQNTSKSKKKRRPKKKKSKRKKYGDESATATDDSCNSRHDIDTNDASAPSSSSTATNRYDSNDLPKDCVQTDDSSPNSEAKFRNTSTSIDIDIDIVKSVHKADAISSKSVAKSSDRKHDKSNNTSKAKTAASKSSKKSDAKPSDSSEAKSSKKVYLSDSVTDSDDDDDRIESKNNAILLGIAERNKLFRSQAIKTSENIQTVEYSNDFALDEDITYRGVVSQKDDVAIDLLTEDIVNFRCFASESTSCTDNDATSLSSSIQSTKFSDFGREYETKYESQDSVEVLSTHDEEITVLVGQSSKSAAVTTTRNAAVSKPGSGPNKSTKSNNATAQNTSKTDLGLSKQQSQNKRNKSSKQSVQQAYVPGLHPKPVSQTVDKVDATVNTSSNTVSFVDSQVKLSKADNQLGANREDIRGLRDGGGSAESSRGNTDRSNVTSRGHGSDTGHELLSYCSYSSVSQSKVADFDLNHAYLRTDSSFPAATLLQASSPSSAHIDKLTEDMNLLNFQMTNDYGNTNTANALGHLSDTPIHSSVLGNPAGKSNLGPIGPPRSSKVIRAPVLPSYPLNIHDRVLFANRVTGTVVFVGQVHFEKGVHVGILPDEFSHGYNNGNDFDLNHSFIAVDSITLSTLCRYC